MYVHTGSLVSTTLVVSAGTVTALGVVAIVEVVEIGDVVVATGLLTGLCVGFGVVPALLLNSVVYLFPFQVNSLKPAFLALLKALPKVSPSKLLVPEIVVADGTTTLV